MTYIGLSGVRRTFKSYVEDLGALADHLKAPQFFVVGVSGGGPYAYAAAHNLPDRVRGVMTISTLAPAGETPFNSPKLLCNWKNMPAVRHHAAMM